MGPAQFAASSLLLPLRVRWCVCILHGCSQKGVAPGAVQQQGHALARAGKQVRLAGHNVAYVDPLPVHSRIIWLALMHRHGRTVSRGDLAGLGPGWSGQFLHFARVLGNNRRG